MLNNKMSLNILNDENNKGNTPFHVAVISNLHDIAELMENNGAIRKGNIIGDIIETDVNTVRDTSNTELRYDS